MNKLSKELKDELNGFNYYTMFIRSAIRDLKTNGICYVYHKKQVDEIIKYTNIPITIVQNECGYTLSVPRRYRREML